MSNLSAISSYRKNRIDLEYLTFGGRNPLAHMIQSIHDISMVDIIEQLESQDHERTREAFERISRLTALAQETTAGPPYGLPELEQRLATIQEALEHAMAIEEKVIFKLIRSVDRQEKIKACHRGDLTQSINSIQRNHGRIEGELVTLLELAENLAVENGECGVCAAIHLSIRNLKSELEAHFRTERETLFPEAIHREAEFAAHGDE